MSKRRPSQVKATSTRRRRFKALLVAVAVLAAAVLVALAAHRGNTPSAASTQADPPRSENRLDLTGSDPVTGRRVTLAAFAGNRSC